MTAAHTPTDPGTGTPAAAPPARPRVRRSALDRTTAMRLAEVEYGRFLEQLRALDPDDWSRQTECPAWDVREMAVHCLGMAEMVATWRELARQNLRAARRPESGVDALTALQVAERADLEPPEIIRRYDAIAPRATAGRRLRSRLIGRVPLPQAQVVGGEAELWTLGFLLDTILTRDTWMHRVDIARATGRELVLTAEHDGRLVADVVAEWAGRHGRPHALTLTGPAGGTWSVGEAGEVLELDAVELCRILSGRAAGTGLLSVDVPF